MRLAVLVLVLGAALGAASAAAPAAGGGASTLAPAGLPAAVLLEAEACMAAPPAKRARTPMQRLVIKSPTDVVEHDDGMGGQSYLNADMYRHEAEGSSSGADGGGGGNGTSCCSGLKCPYEAGICCPGSTHCCDQGYICSSDFPPQCLDERVDESNPDQEGPVRHRITHVTVKVKGHKKQTVHVSPRRNAAGALAGAPGTQGLADTSYAAPASDPAPVPRSEPLPAGVLSLRDYDPATLTRSAGEQAGLHGSVWPPMDAFAPDGTARTYVTEEQRDWAGTGLERNGTFNLVRTEAECRAQCDKLPECRVARFVRTNGECWLDSQVASSPQPCPPVLGRHNCVSFVKRMSQRDMLSFPYPDTVGLTRGEWAVASARNWLPSTAETADAGGRLLRNGKRNRVPVEADCVKQCASLKHCAVAMYLRQTGECWLSSKVARRGVACALRGSTRDCTSYVKRKKDEVRAGDTRPLDASPVGGAAGAAGAGTTVAAYGGGDQAFNIDVDQPN